MTIEQDFLPFAAASGANVISQSTYVSLSALGPGFSSGVAASNQLNKVWRQSSIMAAVIGDLIVEITGQPVIDNGTTTTILSNLLLTLMTANFANDTGVANAYSLTYSPSVTVTEGMELTFMPTHNNSGASTLTVNGSSAKNILAQDGSALQGGEIVAFGPISVVYNGTAFYITANAGGYAHSVTPPSGDNSTKVATTAFATSLVGAGTIGGSAQAWYDESGSRAINTVYTNTTGRPIMVCVMFDAGSSWDVGCAVNGVNIGGTGGNGTPGGTSFIVPAGGTYEVTGSGETISAWGELR